MCMGYGSVFVILYTDPDPDLAFPKRFGFRS
jgi:hypothetical protein